jgi:hypothetical protein
MLPVFTLSQRAVATACDSDCRVVERRSQPASLLRINPSWICWVGETRLGVHSRGNRRRFFPSTHSQDRVSVIQWSIGTPNFGLITDAHPPAHREMSKVVCTGGRKGMV